MKTKQEMLITPELGEIKGGRSLGYKKTGKFIFATCSDCGKGRWVPLLYGKPKTSRCISCSLKGNKHRWRNGRYKASDGYIRVYLEPNDFFRPMANKRGYVREHRLIIAKRLGRCLHLWELVHHKDGIRDNNKDENLQLVSEGAHHTVEAFKARIDTIKATLKRLKQENRELRERLQRTVTGG